ncbi:unnamed protein product, partial [Ilex paraguariensis]
LPPTEPDWPNSAKPILILVLDNDPTDVPPSPQSNIPKIPKSPTSEDKDSPYAISRRRKHISKKKRVNESAPSDHVE